MTFWTRSDHIDRLRNEGPFDVVVIGGGIIGTGSLLDLSARGLRTALVERSDFAQGTSSRSTKLFHGGIRYLPQMHFRLISEGLREQKILARIADFLFEPLEFVIPLYQQYGIADAPKWASRGWRAPLALRAGLIAYDLLGGFGRPGTRHRRIAPRELQDGMPRLRGEGLTGGFAYSDAQTDDARLVVTVAKTAVHRHQAVAATRTEVMSVAQTDRGFRLLMSDRIGGDRFEVDTRAVLCATGAFEPPGMESVSPLKLVRSKGTHLIATRESLDLGGRALVLPETDDGRVMYITPWLGHSMIGTTDTAFNTDPEHPTASREDVEYLIRHVKKYLDVPGFEPISSFAGLRALKDPGGGSTAEASREHAIDEPVPGYVQVAGGKLTTYRRIAADAADSVSRALNHRNRSTTAGIPLVGAAGSRPEMRRRLTQVGISDSAVDPMIGRYGTDVELVARIAESAPELARSLGDGRTIPAEAVYAVRYEAATTLSDFTLRRSHLAWFTPDHGREDAELLAVIMGRELGWDEGERLDQLRLHEKELAAEGL